MLELELHSLSYILLEYYLFCVFIVSVTERWHIWPVSGKEETRAIDLKPR